MTKNSEFKPKLYFQTNGDGQHKSYIPYMKSLIHNFAQNLRYYMLKVKRCPLKFGEQALTSFLLPTMDKDHCCFLLENRIMRNERDKDEELKEIIIEGWKEDGEGEKGGEREIKSKRGKIDLITYAHEYMFAIELKAKNVKFKKKLGEILDTEWKKGNRQINNITDKSLNFFRPESIKHLHKIVLLIVPLYYGGKDENIEWNKKLEPEKVLRGIMGKLDPPPDFGGIWDMTQDTNLFKKYKYWSHFEHLEWYFYPGVLFFSKCY